MATITLAEQYRKEVVPAMQAQFGYKNVMAVPRLEKVVLNIGIGRLRDDKERQEVHKFFALIAGQKAQHRTAKKAIASFKIRQGMTVGYRVTLRGKRMYDFVMRLTRAALPRTRDFQGLDVAAFDGRGNLTIGIKEHIVFPEMIGEDYHLLFGLTVTVVTTAKTRAEGIALLKFLGFPLKRTADAA